MSVARDSFQFRASQWRIMISGPAMRQPSCSRVRGLYTKNSHSTIKYLSSIYQHKPITMQRESGHLVMTKIRRITHPPREAQCFARLLLMQVILVCVAHAAQRTWMKRRADGGGPGVDVTPEDIPVTETSEIGVCEPDPADAPVIPLRSLWESFTGRGVYQEGSPGRSCLARLNQMDRMIGQKRELLDPSII
ncbi:MAG: hypothetical protein A4E34_02292 [Methanoregula sp. PtaU1.Bin006]|nr:MAG: hypothetical protein A4E33_00601 [Methanoregula sp. PtaB.Bin085]OPY32915.1 MAG: hypothetical protein A4E34_02292 [Methanoregula sp. PtaU1.Bin006]